MTHDDSRFDFIRHKDYQERSLYKKLYHSLRTEIDLGDQDNYKSPVNSQCIRSCIEILSSFEIKFSGYTNLFIKRIATLCDKIPSQCRE